MLSALAWVVLPAPLSVRAAAWTDHLDSLPLLALGGVLVGYLLARARVYALLAHPLALVLGFEVVTLVFTRVAEGDTQSERVDWLAARVGAWLETIQSGGASSDTLMFALGMAALAWTLGYASAWLLFRHGAPWQVAAIDAIALLVNLSYAPPAEASYFVWLLLGACALVVVHQYGRRREAWRAARVAVEGGVARSVLVGSAAAAMGVVGLAWALPPAGTSPLVGAEWERVSTPWQALESRFDRLFASLRGPALPAARGLNFGRTLTPRSSFDLPDTPVLLVRSPRRLYWRATTTDRYTGQAMVSTDTSTTHATAQESIVAQDQVPAARVEVQTVVKVLANRSAVVFAPEMPIRLSVSSAVETRGGVPDVTTIRPDSLLRQDDVYTATSVVSNASVQELQAAGTDYPDWVVRRYLQLPRGLPARVRQLAAEVTHGAATPFDKAAALESYLRSTYTYSTHVPELPAGRDWVDYFLFDSREGYCDYFATAMVVLLRTQGVPARVASGFAPGDFDPGMGAWLVRENQAHSWVEAYFPRYGWITFEPSAIRPVPERQQQAQPTPLPTADTLGSDTGSRPALLPNELDELRNLAGGGSAGGPFSGPARVAVAAILGLLALAGVVLGVLALVWQRGLRGLTWYQRPYVQLLRLGRWLGVRGLHPSRTPYEAAEALADEVPEAGPAIRHLAQAYVEGTYGGREPRFNPVEAWVLERRRLAAALLKRRLARVSARLPWRRRGG